MIVFFIVSCQSDANQDFTNIEPEISLSADNLILNISNEQNEKEMVVAVAGLVHEINHVNKRTTILLKGSTKKETYIICDINPNQADNIKAIKEGDSILVKGLLKGMLRDVIMLNCIIAKTK
ncbi:MULTISPECIES: OB-fold protein [unclassified Croceitalea]|uniref:OB-fold protein n=1 Tax=unclassified Croceitalea TaxID=2632280 RepID=UPI0030DB7E83